MGVYKEYEFIYDKDNITYEEDKNVDSEDLDEIVEYTDDEDEDSLFSTPSTNSEDSLYEDNSPVTPAVEKNIPETPSEEPEKPEEPEEDVGEEFDTSLIDSLDDDESVEENKNDSFDETMVFNSDDFGTTYYFRGSKRS